MSATRATGSRADVCPCCSTRLRVQPEDGSRLTFQCPDCETPLLAEVASAGGDVRIRRAVDPEAVDEASPVSSFRNLLAGREVSGRAVSWKTLGPAAAALTGQVALALFASNGDSADPSVGSSVDSSAGQIAEAAASEAEGGVSSTGPVSGEGKPAEAIDTPESAPSEKFAGSHAGAERVPDRRSAQAAGAGADQVGGQTGRTSGSDRDTVSDPRSALGPSPASRPEPGVSLKEPEIALNQAARDSLRRGDPPSSPGPSADAPSPAVGSSKSRSRTDHPRTAPARTESVVEQRELPQETGPEDTETAGRSGSIRQASGKQPEEGVSLADNFVDRSDSRDVGEPESASTVQQAKSRTVPERVGISVESFRQTEPVRFGDLVRIVEQIGGVRIDTDRVDEESLNRKLTLSLKETTPAGILHEAARRVGLSVVIDKESVRLVPAKKEAGT